MAGGGLLENRVRLDGWRVAWVNARLSWTLQKCVHGRGVEVLAYLIELKVGCFGMVDGEASPCAQQLSGFAESRER